MPMGEVKMKMKIRMAAGWDRDVSRRGPEGSGGNFQGSSRLSSRHLFTTEFTRLVGGSVRGFGIRSRGSFDLFVRGLHLVGHVFVTREVGSVSISPGILMSWLAEDKGYALGR